MSENVDEKNRGEIALDQQVEDLDALVEGIEIAMLTTRMRDGQMVSRRMSTQRRRSNSPGQVNSAAQTVAARTGRRGSRRAGTCTASSSGVLAAAIGTVSEEIQRATIAARA